MLSPNISQLKNYFFWAVIVGLILLGAWIALPFTVAILSAYFLAYMARPLFLQLESHMPSSLAAGICVFITLVLIVVPVSVVAWGTFHQVGDTISGRGLSRYVTIIATHPQLRDFHINQVQLQTQLSKIITDTSASIIASIPSMALGFMIALIGMFYILCCWKSLNEELRKYIPFKNKERIVREMDKTTSAILYGTLVMAILEFFVSFLGFSISGVDSSLIISVIIFILAFIPSIGPIMVWLPLAIFYLSSQQYEVALGVIITGLILTVGIEVILYTKWIGDRTRIHPFIMLIGVIGGINLFGIFGFIIGPLILANAKEIVEEVVEAD